MMQQQGMPPQQVMDPQMMMMMQQQQQQEQQQYQKAKTNLNKYPAMMDLQTYGDYKKAEKEERKRKPQKRANMYGYVFSDLLREDIMRDMKRTQGSFLIGVNLSNLFKEFRKMVATDKTLEELEKEKQMKGKSKNSEETFKKVGEYVDVDFDKILTRKMGFRNDSNTSLLPEIKLDRTSTFDQIIDESKHYADIGYKGKITPYGLLIMTRMLFKYKKNIAQWMRVATVLELIYKYLGGTQTRQNFFNNRDEIPILSLMDLEEFYNTDHIFMTEKELLTFKTNLDYYKYDITKKIEMKLAKVGDTVENL